MAIYFYHLPIQNLVKIGTSQDVEQRLKTLATGCTEIGVLIRTIEDYSFKAEKWLHAYFKHLWVKGEWFQYSDDMLSVEIPNSVDRTLELPCFDMLCTTRRRGKVNSKDMYTILENLSAPATKLFWTFIRTRNEDSNQVRYLPVDKPERLKLDKAYKELHTLEVIKRVKQGVYLINPSAYLCTASKFEEVKAHWESLP